MKNTKNKKNILAFSILEIVVILFIVILIWSVAYSSFLIFSKNSRDATRTSDISYIWVWLNNYKAKNGVFPSNSGAIEVTSMWEIVNNQWFVSSDILESIGIPDVLTDPDRNVEYTYVTDSTDSKYQLLALLENNWDEGDNINFWKRIPYTYWSELWVFLNIADNTPIQETINENIELEYWIFGNYIVYLNDDKYAQNQDIKVEMWFRINPIASCQHILKNGDSHWDGIYTINPDKLEEFEVYCDMTTDWGWWTLFYANNWFEDSPIAESYVDMRTKVEEADAYELTDYSWSMLAWLIDYNYFTDNGAKEILMKNNAVADEGKWWKIYFDSSDTLSWALWEEVLWTGIAKCVDLPKWATWWLTNDSWTDNYKDLTQMMAHGWSSWWVSHSSYDCNWYVAEGILPHVAFYSANSNDYGNRARSNMLIWWEWWWENEYRYFMR